MKCKPCFQKDLRENFEGGEEPSYSTEFIDSLTSGSPLFP